MATARKSAPAKPRARKTPTKPGLKKAPSRQVAKPVARPAPAPAVPVPKAEKAKKAKLVRDSFTIPKAEYTVLDGLKQRAAKAGAPAKKSEVLRAGIKALAAMGDHAFLAALASVPAVKTGRPAKD